MKLKKIALALAAMLATCSLAACGNTDQKIDFNDYWEQNALAAGSAIDETLTYKVTYEKGSGVDALGYSLNYGEGSYVTTLKTNPQGYIYTTALTIPVTFQYGEETETVTDSVTTEVVFLRSKDALRPLSSTKTVVSHTPQNGDVAVIKDCYSLYDFTVVTTYPDEGKATSTATYKTENGDVVKTSSFTASDKKYSYLDNEQLLLALRAISPSTTSGSVKIYNPFIESKQKIDFAFSEEVGAEFSYTLNGTATKENITYRPVSLTIDDKNPGSTQTAWIAKRGDAHNNRNRNVMLKLTVPLSYSIGSLVYDLVSIAR